MSGPLSQPDFSVIYFRRTQQRDDAGRTSLSLSLEDTSLKPILRRQWYTLCGAVIKTSESNGDKGTVRDRGMEKSGIEKAAPFSRSWWGLGTGESRRQSLEFFSLPAYANTCDDNDIGSPCTYRSFSFLTFPRNVNDYERVFVKTGFTSCYFSSQWIRWKSRNSLWGDFEFLIWLNIDWLSNKSTYSQHITTTRLL